MGALEAAGTAATASLERALAAIAFGAMGGMSASPLRVTLAASLGLGRAGFTLTLVIAPALADWLNRRTGSRRT